MTKTSSRPAKPQSADQVVDALLSSAQRGLHDRYGQCQSAIRKSPTSAVLGAVAVGYLLHLLPGRAILIAVVRVLSTLTLPVLFLLGGARLYAFLQKRALDA